MLDNQNEDLRDLPFKVKDKTRKKGKNKQRKFKKNKEDS
jgi:hypothetical protein